MVLFPDHPRTLEIKKYIDNYKDLFYREVPQDWKENRKLTDEQLIKILGGNLIKMEDFENENIFVLGEYLHYINPSLAIKLGVNVVLFGGALYSLGNERHRSIIQQLLDGKIKGCFSMTEISHGSNLKHLKTTCKKRGNRYILDSGDDEGVKCWIGGGTIADYTVVFAQLYDEKDIHLGLHAILVDLKTKGVEVIDMGPKMGLNGIDNSYIRFRLVEVPIENLLDKYGGFQKNGEYSSTIRSMDVRFSKMLSALSMGRISIAMGSYAIAYKACMIALKYSFVRRQFLMKGEKEEKRIIEYNTQLERFILMINRLHFMKLGILDLIKIYKKDGINKKVHALSSLLKVYCSWNSVKITNLCREMCGGHGYLWKNQLPLLLNDVHIYQTFEGDNTVLIQQGVKWILDEYSINKLHQILKLLKIYSPVNNMIEKIENRLNCSIASILFALTQSKNKEKVWLDNLREIVKIGLDYTELYLLQLHFQLNHQAHKKENIFLETFSYYVYSKKIPFHLLQKYKSYNLLEGIIKEWDRTHQNITSYIPIANYNENYLKSCL